MPYTIIENKGFICIIKENLPDFVCSSSLVEAFCIYANNQMTKRLASAGMLPENVEIRFFPKGDGRRDLCAQWE